MIEHLMNGLRGATIVLVATVGAITLGVLWLVVPIAISEWTIGRSPWGIVVFIVWILFTLGFVMGVRKPPPRLFDKRGSSQ